MHIHTYTHTCNERRATHIMVLMLQKRQYGRTDRVVVPAACMRETEKPSVCDFVYVCVCVTAAVLSQSDCDPCSICISARACVKKRESTRE